MQQPESAAQPSKTGSLTLTRANSLAVTLEAEAVVPLPCSASAGAQLVGCVTFVSQTPVLLASAGQTTKLTVLVHWVHNPVDTCILHVV